MNIIKTSLPEVLVLENPLFCDTRGHFREAYQERTFSSRGIPAKFVQDNISRSKRGVLRGLHFQEPSQQGKLIQVIRGNIFDVAVDIRQGSPRFGRWIGLNLSDLEGKMIWVPEGFAHGFEVLSDTADVLYKVTDYWAPATERSIRWDDPEIGIDWPILNPILTDKDSKAPTLDQVAVLPQYRSQL